MEVTQFAKDDVKVKIMTKIPVSGWSYDEGKRCLVENDDPTAFGAGAIQFEVRENVEKFDFYKDDFENYQDIEDRVIGGISFRGRTYRNIGYDWIQYIAQLDDGRALSIGLRNMDCVPGTMPDIILNDMTFQEWRHLSENLYENRLPPQFGAGESGYLRRVYLKTPNAPGQRVFLRCAASFFLEIRQYSREKMSCSTQKSLAAGHIMSFQIHPRNGGDAVKLKTFLITASLWMGLLGLTACGGADVRTYQYPETALLFDSLHIKKTVYSPGVMELYYRGGQFKDNPIRCYDANFEDLGDQFDHAFRNGVLTVQADFAEQISGLTIEDKDHDTVYHLRYLDSPQFAWLADTFWLDYGMMTLGDEARYYSDAERQAQAERERAEHAQTRNVFALLEGTWISEDGLQKYVFSTDADGSELRAAELWRSGTEQMWNGWELRIESAFQTPYFGGEYGEDVAEHLQEIVLRNSDHAAADLHLLYDTQNAVILGGGMTYRREQG